MYIENPDEEQNKQQSSSAPSVGAGGGGAAISGGGTSTGGNPSTIQPVQTNQPNQSFATVQDYLKANQQQGEDFGNNFVNTISPGVGQAKSTIDTSAQNAQNEITAGTVNTNKDLLNQAVSNPTAITGDQGKLAEFQKEYNAQYTGPSSFESSDQYAPASLATNQAVQTGQELGTAGGREQLLQDQFGVYGQGNKGLDQGLLQNSSAYSNVPALAQNFQSVQNYLNAAAGNTNTAATNASATTQATKDAAKGAFSNNLTNFQNDINARTQAAQNAATTQANAYTTALQSGDVNQISSVLQNSNLTDAQRSNLVDYLTEINKDFGNAPSLANNYNFNPQTAITSSSVATPQDYVNAAAYQQLTGVDYSGVLNPANASQAGVIANPNTGINSAQTDQQLRQYLVQKEMEANGQTPVTTPTSGTSSPNGASNDLSKGIGIAGGNVLTGGIPVKGIQQGISSTINKAANYVQNTLGIGPKHHDAVVNLPPLQLSNMAIPQTANAATTKAITDIYSKPLTTTGSYHEDAVKDMVSRLGTLKQALDSKQISAQEYRAYAAPLAQWANSAYQTILNSGNTAAKTVVGSYPSFQSTYGNLINLPPVKAQ